MSNNLKKKPVAYIGRYRVYQLDKQIASRYIKFILRLVNYIPMKEYTREEILSESQTDRTFYGKWAHSLITFDDNKPIAIIIAYEREAENHPCYRQNSIYISELAVDKNHRRQGIAREMLTIFFQQSTRFIHLKGKPTYTIQTNSAAWNEPVQRLYESFGYKTIGVKEYSNRTDLIMKK